MNKYIVWLIIGGFGAWAYNEYRKEKNATKPKLK
jgi:hypothetical protein